MGGPVPALAIAGQLLAFDLAAFEPSESGAQTALVAFGACDGGRCPFRCLEEGICKSKCQSCLDCLEGGEHCRVCIQYDCPEDCFDCGFPQDVTCGIVCADCQARGGTCIPCPNEHGRDCRRCSIPGVGVLDSAALRAGASGPLTRLSASDEDRTRADVALISDPGTRQAAPPFEIGTGAFLRGQATPI